MPICLTRRRSVVNVGEHNLLPVTSPENLESVTGAIFLDFKSIFLYQRCQPPCLVYVDGLFRKAIPIDAFTADMADRDQCVFLYSTFRL